MAKGIKKFEMGISPIGEAQYCFVNKTRPVFEEDKGKKEPRYSLDLLLDKDDKDVIAWAKSISALTKFKKMPFSVDNDGKLRVRFSSRFKPIAKDANNNNMPENVIVSSGSILRVAYVPAEYPGFGGGITLYLHGVQVIQLSSRMSVGNVVEFPTVADTDQYKANDSVPEEEAAPVAQDDSLPF
jgi:hypothetical protein